MNVYDVIMSRRTIRKFKQKPVSRDTLVKIVDAARMAPTGRNSQPLSFGIIAEKELCGKIFPLTGWAAYLNGTYTPSESERPTAYIAVFTDVENKTTSETAAGAAVENMLIMAQAEGVGSCWLGSVNREKVLELLGSPKNKWMLYLVALGLPAESPVASPFKGDIKYFLDDNKVINVPKKSFKDVVIIDK
jgi:nitroreductase